MRTLGRRGLAITMGWLVVAAFGGAVEPTDQPPRRPRPIVLVDVADEVGLTFAHSAAVDLDPRHWLMVESFGSGVAVVDIDRDGWDDVVLGQADGRRDGGRMVRRSPDRWFRNIGGRFVDVTDAVAPGMVHKAPTMGLAVGDLNADGFADLVVTTVGRNAAYLNRGDGSFTPHPTYVDDDPVFSASAAIGDLDGDAISDIVEVNYGRMEDLMDVRFDNAGRRRQRRPTEITPAVDRVRRQSAAGAFRDKAFDPDAASTGLGVAVGRFGSPGERRSAWNPIDVFIANDSRPNHWWTRRDDTWIDVAAVIGVADNHQGLPTACMGVAATDVDRDLRCDLLITNYAGEPASVYVSGGRGIAGTPTRYVDRCVAMGVAGATTPHVGFGCRATDLNGDGWEDLILVNGHVDPTFGPPAAPTQIGARSTAGFDWTAIDVDTDAAWRRRRVGRTAAVIDYDRDRDADVIAGFLDAPVALLENRTPAAADRLRIVAVGRRSARDPVGTVVDVRIGENRPPRRFWMNVDGYLTGGPLMADVSLPRGLAAARLAAAGGRNRVEVTVHWPDGGRQTVSLSRRDADYLIVQDQPPWRFSMPSR